MRSPVIPPFGFAFSNYSVPVDITFDHTVIGAKRGEAQSTGILGLFSFGDASVQAAARNGNITRVDHIGCDFTNILCIVTMYTTVAYGE